MSPSEVRVWLDRTVYPIDENGGDCRSTRPGLERNGDGTEPIRCEATLPASFPGFIDTYHLYHILYKYPACEAVIAMEVERIVDTLTLYRPSGR